MKFGLALIQGIVCTALVGGFLAGGACLLVGLFVDDYDARLVGFPMLTLSLGFFSGYLYAQED